MLVEDIQNPRQSIRMIFKEAARSANVIEFRTIECVSPAKQQCHWIYTCVRLIYAPHADFSCRLPLLGSSDFGRCCALRSFFSIDSNRLLSLWGNWKKNGLDIVWWKQNKKGKQHTRNWHSQIQKNAVYIKSEWKKKKIWNVPGLWSQIWYVSGSEPQRNVDKINIFFSFFF